MFIKIICIIALLEFSSLSEYDAKFLPMDKDSKYGDDVCHYMDNERIYVKPCEKGKFCDVNRINTIDYARGKDIEKNGHFGICRELPKVSKIFTLNEKGCSNDFECERSYKCIDNVCREKCGSLQFLAYDRCRSDTEKGSDSEICYEVTTTLEEKYSPPNGNKECAKIVSFTDVPSGGGLYYVNKKAFAFPGEVEDGEYVTDEKFCKSGFALYFFKDGKTEDPKEAGGNTMYLRCVIPLYIYSDYVEANTPHFTECLINYKIKEDGEILRYDIRQLNGLSLANGLSPITDYCDDRNKYNREFIKLRSEKYREFYTTISEEERKTCGDLDNANKYTCENNELIKLWYIYKETEDYLNYNDRKKIGKVLDFNIQIKYPCYSLSKFLSIKFIYLLFLLLF